MHEADFCACTVQRSREFHLVHHLAAIHIRAFSAPVTALEYGLCSDMHEGMPVGFLCFILVWNPMLQDIH